MSSKREVGREGLRSEDRLAVRTGFTHITRRPHSPPNLSAMIATTVFGLALCLRGGQIDGREDWLSRYWQEFRRHRWAVRHWRRAWLHVVARTPLAPQMQICQFLAAQETSRLTPLAAGTSRGAVAGDGPATALWRPASTESVEGTPQTILAQPTPTLIGRIRATSTTNQQHDCQHSRNTFSRLGNHSQTAPLTRCRRSILFHKRELSVAEIGFSRHATLAEPAKFSSLRQS